MRRVASVQASLRPSIATRKLWLRDSTDSVSSTWSRSVMGRAFRLWEATGVMQNVPDWGTMMGPPTLKKQTLLFDH